MTTLSFSLKDPFALSNEAVPGRLPSTLMSIVVFVCASCGLFASGVPAKSSQVSVRRRPTSLEPAASLGCSFDEHSAAFYARMKLIDGADRMGLRFTLLERTGVAAPHNPHRRRRKSRMSAVQRSGTMSAMLCGMCS